VVESRRSELGKLIFHSPLGSSPAGRRQPVAASRTRSAQKTDNLCRKLRRSEPVQQQSTAVSPRLSAAQRGSPTLSAPERRLARSTPSLCKLRVSIRFHGDGHLVLLRVNLHSTLGWSHTMTVPFAQQPRALRSTTRIGPTGKLTPARRCSAARVCALSRATACQPLSRIAERAGRERASSWARSSSSSDPDRSARPSRAE
jgi:hypothetical protein